MSRAHPSLAPLGVRLAALGHAALGFDLAHAGGSLCAEAAGVSVLERLVALVAEAAARDVASGRADLVAEIARLRLELAAAKGAT